MGKKQSPCQGGMHFRLRCYRTPVPHAFVDLAAVQYLVAALMGSQLKGALLAVLQQSDVKIFKGRM
jgi:hypothetical protein